MSRHVQNESIVEVARKEKEAFAMHRAAFESESESLHQAENLIEDLAGEFGLEIQADTPPVPMFSTEKGIPEAESFADFESTDENSDEGAIFRSN